MDIFKVCLVQAGAWVAELAEGALQELPIVVVWGEGETETGL